MSHDYDHNLIHATHIHTIRTSHELRLKYAVGILLCSILLAYSVNRSIFSSLNHA